MRLSRSSGDSASKACRSASASPLWASYASVRGARGQISRSYGRFVLVYSYFTSGFDSEQVDSEMANKAGIQVSLLLYPSRLGESVASRPPIYTRKLLRS